MSIVRVKHCPSYEVKHHSVQIDKMAVIARTRTAMHFIIVVAVQIILSDVLANYNGMIERKNAAGNHQFVVVHRKKCFPMKIDSIQHFVQEKPTGKRIKNENENKSMKNVNMFIMTFSI